MDGQGNWENLAKELDSLYQANSCDHDSGHIRRVLANARLIGEKEKAEMMVLLPAALLHDIALKKGKMAEVNSRHAWLGAEIAGPILEKYNYSSGVIKKIQSVIRQHSLDSPTDELRTLEGNCLFDADKLDAVSPLGFCRYLQEQALVSNSEPLGLARKSVQYLSGIHFYTKTGRALGAEIVPVTLELVNNVIACQQ